MLLTRLDAISPGIYEVAIDLAHLYADDESRTAFETRWSLFAGAEMEHVDIFRRDGDHLLYRTESFLPPVGDGRVPVLLVLGNPASQSVHAGMCFAFERGARGEHRFWRALRATEWLMFEADRTDDDVSARNARRRDLLLCGRYDSPFAVGIDVFFSFPSPASAPRWAGVAGLGALFGRSALQRISAEERVRLAATLRDYDRRGGAVVAFQRDAYDGLRDGMAPQYSATLAREGQLRSSTAAGVSIPLLAAPPTRLAHTATFQRVLRSYREEISGRQVRS